MSQATGCTSALHHVSRFPPRTAVRNIGIGRPDSQGVGVSVGNYRNRHLGFSKTCLPHTEASHCCENGDIFIDQCGSGILTIDLTNSRRHLAFESSTKCQCQTARGYHYTLHAVVLQKYSNFRNNRCTHACYLV